MGKKLVLVGAGHAHLTTMSAIKSLVQRGHVVTVIAPSDHHYYSGMAPGMLAGTYSPQQVRFNVHKMTIDRGGCFIRGKVSRIEADLREVQLEDGSTVPYDVASFNVGSMVTPGRLDLHVGNIFPVKPIERILEGRNAIIDLGRHRSSGQPLKLVVVGGGPAGVEMAGGLWRMTREKQISSRITLVTGGSLLSLFPDRFKNRVQRNLRKKGIQVMEGSRVSSVQGGRILTEDRSVVGFDVSFVATGVMPSRLFKESGIAVGGDGGLLVNDFLQSVKYPEIFGGGDCITLHSQNLARVGVYAVRQNPILLHNLSAALEDKPLVRFDPGKPNFLLILNMGDGTAVFRKGEWIFNGRPAWWIKNFIDTRFMRKFQLSGELEEEM